MYNMCTVTLLVGTIAHSTGRAGGDSEFTARHVTTRVRHERDTITALLSTLCQLGAIMTHAKCCHICNQTYICLNTTINGQIGAINGHVELRQLVHWSRQRQSSLTILRIQSSPSMIRMFITS